MKNPNDTIGNRIRDLPTGNAVPQPTALRRAPLLAVVRSRKCLSSSGFPIVETEGGKRFGNKVWCHHSLLLMSENVHVNDTMPIGFLSNLILFLQAYLVADVRSLVLCV